MESEKKIKKVTFNDKIEVHEIVTWEYAYRKARIGPWQAMARDSARFKRRIELLKPTLEKVLITKRNKYNCK